MEKEKQTEKQKFFFGSLCMIFVTVLILSNISASNTFYITDFLSLSAAELLFPFSYVINDLLAEFYGAKTTNKVVCFGLGLTLFGTIFLALTTLIPSNYVEYNTVFGCLTSGVVGITIASIVAYFVGTFVNTFIMDKFKKKDNSQKTGKFFKRAFVSSVFAEVFDSLVFITLCCIFAPQYYTWGKLISFVLTISAIKLTVELVCFPLLNWIRKIVYKKGLVKEQHASNKIIISPKTTKGE